MANILVAITTLLVSAVLVSFGAYQSYYAVKRTDFTTRISGSLGRLTQDVQAVQDDLGRVATSADIGSGKTSAENAMSLGKVTYTIGNTGTYSYVCARATSAQEWMVEAMRRAGRDFRSAVVGNNCDATSGESTTAVAVTVRIV